LEREKAELGRLVEDVGGAMTPQFVLDRTDITGEYLELVPESSGEGADDF